MRERVDNTAKRKVVVRDRGARRRETGLGASRVIVWQKQDAQVRHLARALELFQLRKVLVRAPLVTDYGGKPNVSRVEVRPQRRVIGFRANRVSTSSRLVILPKLEPSGAFPRLR